MMADMKEIVKKFNFTEGEHLAKMYYEKAKASADLLSKELGSTQFRKFYDKILELNERAKRVDESGFKVKVLPMLSMMYSKVAYAKERKVAGNNFEIFMKKCLDLAKTKETLNNMTLFLEAVIGFMPKNKRRG